MAALKTNETYKNTKNHLVIHIHTNIINKSYKNKKHKLEELLLTYL